MDESRLDRLLALRAGPVAQWLESQKENVNESGPRSFQTGPGRISLGAFVPSDGAGMPADRVSDAEDAQAEAPVPVRLLRPNWGRLLHEHVSDDAVRPRPVTIASGGVDACLYIDPEQTASRDRTWDDAA